MCEYPSNWRCKVTLDEYLKKQKVVGLAGIDTRRLTRKLRGEGVMNGVIYTEGFEPDEQTIAEMKETFGHKPIIVQFPVNPGPSFDGFIDVLKMKYYHFKDDNGTREDLDIPANLKDEAETLRQELIEKAA